MCREAVVMLRSRLEANADPGQETLPIRHQSFRAPLAIRASSMRIADTPQIPPPDVSIHP
jgi:hypothetical protein